MHDFGHTDPSGGKTSDMEECQHCTPLKMEGEQKPKLRLLKKLHLRVNWFHPHHQHRRTSGIWMQHWCTNELLEMHSPVNLLPSLKSNSSHVIEQTGRLSKHKAYLDAPFPSVQRDVMVVQLDQFILVKDRIIIAVTQGVVGCHWRRARGDIFFMASVIRFFFFGLDSLGRAYMQSHIWSWLCLYQLLSACPAQRRLPRLQRWEQNSPVVKQQQTSLPDTTGRARVRVWREEEGGRGRSGPAAETNAKRTECVFWPHASPNRSKGLFFWKDMTVGKQCPHCESKHCIM